MAEPVEKYKLTPEMVKWVQEYKKLSTISKMIQGKMMKNPQLRKDGPNKEEWGNYMKVFGQVIKGQQSLIKNAPKTPEHDLEGQPQAGELDQFLINY